MKRLEGVGVATTNNQLDSAVARSRAILLSNHCLYCLSVPSTKASYLTDRKFSYITNIQKRPQIWPRQLPSNLNDICDM